MKKTVLLIFSISSVFFLSACNKTSLQLSYDVPEIKIESITGEMIDNNADWISVKVVSWYNYIYYYQDLWLEISVENKRSLVHEKYFLNRFTGEIFSREKNKIYSDGEYIELFKKDKWISLDQEVENKHLNDWCVIQTWIIWNQFGAWLSWFYAVYISSEDWNVVGDEGCVLDENSPENSNPVVFVSQTNNSEKYLKISVGDACAPGPCSVFWEIKFR